MQKTSNFPHLFEVELEPVGGEPLGGSGFETEEIEPDFDGGKGVEE